VRELKVVELEAEKRPPRELFRLHVPEGTRVGDRVRGGPFWIAPPGGAWLDPSLIPAEAARAGRKRPREMPPPLPTGHALPWWRRRSSIVVVLTLALLGLGLLLRRYAYTGSR